MSTFSQVCLENLLVGHSESSISPAVSNFRFH